MRKDSALSLYYQMLRIRMVEEAIARVYTQWQMRCPVHLCIGQEAVAAGLCANLLKKDYVLSNHRSHGHYLAKGGSLKAMFSEIYGKENGCSGGKGGSMHLVDLDAGILGSTPIVAGIIPVAAGVAFGIQMKKEHSISVAFFGDAATEEGVFAESLNFAALKKLPVIFVCENNYFSVYSPLSVRQPKKRNNLSIARGFGVEGEEGDGNDVEYVFKAAKKAVMYARSLRGPYYLQFDTYRFREHCGPNFDNELGYRTEIEFSRWCKRCPLETYQRKLLHKGSITAKIINEYKTGIQLEINEAVSFAQKSPFPKPGEAFTGVYA
ncbi:MAG: thiamine pyrophosphate-dependent dehydrogenase E1 component subunit alpha [Candidatus Omnitrophota bacterium]|jgi:pyruvate dehydrogenase E1 component alpha subunit